jgi:hypothetical protein
MRRAALTLGLCLALLLAASPARAALRFFLAPAKNFLLDEKVLFRAKGEALPHDDLLNSLQRHLEVQLGKKAWVEVANPRELVKVLAHKKEYEDGLVLGREWMNLAEEHYDSLRVDDAVRDLRRAEDTYLKIFQDIAEPAAIARTHLLQGLCFVEQGLKGQSHVAFRRMFFANPWVRFERGYYPPRAEDELRSSAVDFVLTHPKDDPFPGEGRLAQFFKQYPFDYLVYAYLADAGQGPRLHLLVYDRGKPEPVLHEVLPVGADDEQVVFQADAALSRWLACVDLEPPVARPDRVRGRLGFLVDSAHSTYLTTPSRGYFYNVGYGVLGFYALTRNLDLFVLSEFYTSVLDRYRDIQRNFNTLRTQAGVGLTFGSEHVRGFLYPALDVHYLGDFQIVNNAYCKLYGTDSPQCPAGGVFSLDLKLLVGFNLGMGVRVFLTDHIFMQLSASISTYFIPFNRVIDLNFPVAGALGLGYRL